LFTFATHPVDPNLILIEPVSESFSLSKGRKDSPVSFAAKSFLNTCIPPPVKLRTVLHFRLKNILKTGLLEGVFTGFRGVFALRQRVKMAVRKAYKGFIKLLQDNHLPAPKSENGRYVTKKHLSDVMARPTTWDRLPENRG
jgi:hypothetical protein